MSAGSAISQTPPTNAGIKPFLLGWCICLIALQLYGALFILKTHKPNDFPSFYAAEHLARTDPGHLYDFSRQAQLQLTLASQKVFLPFYHPIYEPFFLSPLSVLSYRTSYFVTVAFNMLLLMAAFFAARSAFSSFIPVWQPRPGLLFFVFTPLFVAVLIGQDSTLSLLLYCLTWRQLEKGKDTSAGVFLALALFKFQIVIPIAALIALRKGWRFTSGFLLTAVGVVLVCIRIGGRAGAAAYIKVLANAGSAAGNTAVAQHHMGISTLKMPNLAGLLYGCGGQFLHSPIAFEVLSAIASIALFFWCARVVRHAELKVAFSIAILCGLLVSYHLFNYDLTVALLPVTLLANRINRYALVGLLVLPIIIGAFSLDWICIVAAPILLMLGQILVTESQIVTPKPAAMIGA